MILEKGTKVRLKSNHNYKGTVESTDKHGTWLELPRNKKPVIAYYLNDELHELWEVEHMPHTDILNWLNTI